MKCIILAAGYATRLYPLTENFPKPLLQVGNKTILDWLVDDLSPVIDEFVVVTNHRFAEQFRKWAETKNEKITVLDDGTTTNESRLGAVRDLEFTLEMLQKNNAGLPIREDCMVMAGDNVLDFSLWGFVRFAQEKGTSCVMCHEENNLQRQQKTAIITMDTESRITSYEEKPTVPKGNYAVPPFYYYKAADIIRVSEALENGCGFDAPGNFAAWLSQRTEMHAYVMPGKRYDIGDMESYRRVQTIFR